MAEPVSGALTKAQFRGYPCQPFTGSPAHDAGKGVHAQHASQLPHSGVRLVINRAGQTTPCNLACLIYQRPNVAIAD